MKCSRHPLYFSPLLFLSIIIITLTSISFAQVLKWDSPLPRPGGNWDTNARGGKWSFEVRVRNNKKKYNWTRIDLNRPFCEYDNINGKLKQRQCYSKPQDVPDQLVNIDNQIVIGGSFRKSMISAIDHVILFSADIISGWQASGYPIYRWQSVVITAGIPTNLRYNPHTTTLINPERYPDSSTITPSNTRSLKWEVQPQVKTNNNKNKQAIDNGGYIKSLFLFPTGGESNCVLYVDYSNPIGHLNWRSCTLHPFYSSDDSKGIIATRTPWIQVKVDQKDWENNKFKDNDIKLVLALERITGGWDRFSFDNAAGRLLNRGNTKLEYKYNGFRIIIDDYKVFNTYYYHENYLDKPIININTQLIQSYPYPLGSYLLTSYKVKWVLSLDLLQPNGIDYKYFTLDWFSTEGYDYTTGSEEIGITTRNDRPNINLNVNNINSMQRRNCEVLLITNNDNNNNSFEIVWGKCYETRFSYNNNNINKKDNNNNNNFHSNNDHDDDDYIIQVGNDIIISNPWVQVKIIDGMKYYYPNTHNTVINKNNDNSTSSSTKLILPIIKNINILLSAQLSPTEGPISTTTNNNSGNNNDILPGIGINTGTSNNILIIWDDFIINDDYQLGAALQQPTTRIENVYGKFWVSICSLNGGRCPTTSYNTINNNILNNHGLLK